MTTAKNCQNYKTLNKKMLNYVGLVQVKKFFGRALRQEQAFTV